MNARSLTEALSGKWHGSYGVCRCPGHDDRTPSLSVRDGDDGKVLIHCHASCEQDDVLAALRRLGLWGGDVEPSPAPRLKPANDNPNHEPALRIWRESQPAARTLVVTYWGGRAITIEPPASIRFHPGLKHAPTGLLLPAMVAAVQSVDGRIQGIHRTFLRIDGQTKAPVTNAKMMLGKCSGGAVRLALAGPKLAVGEGVETMLSVQQATGIPSWAALSTSGLKALVVPAHISEVIVFADRDEAGETAAQTLASRLASQGRVAKIARPPFPFNDFNECLIDETTENSDRG